MEYFVVVGAEEVGSWKKKKKGRRGRCEEEEEGNKREELKKEKEYVLRGKWKRIRAGIFVSEKFGLIGLPNIWF